MPEQNKDIDQGLAAEAEANEAAAGEAENYLNQEINEMLKRGEAAQEEQRKKKMAAIAEFKKYHSSSISVLEKVKNQSLPPAVKLGLVQSDFEAFLIWSERFFEKVLKID